MNDETSSFAPKTLMGLTILISLIAILFSADDDTAILVYFFAGFIYTVVLRISLIKSLSIGRTIAALLVLGISAIFVWFAIAPMVLLPYEIMNSQFARYLGYLFPSLAGAIVTLISLKYLWNVRVSKSHWILVTTSMLLAPLVTVILLVLFEQTIYGKYMSLSLNSILWWLSFSLSIVAAQSHANKFKNENAASGSDASSTRPF